MILVTGSAGFIGFHVVQALLDRGEDVVGVDNITPYYDPALKLARLARLEARDRYRHLRIDLADREATAALFRDVRPQHVIHLAAQAGVRHSLKAPEAYVDSNLVGFANILEACRHHGVEHLTFASSSSVYGANAAMPFSPHDGADHPLSLYAATKKANEVMAHAYSHLFRSGVAITPPNYPPNLEKVMVKNDVEWMAKNRDRILAEWTKRYDGKSAPR